MLFLLNILNAQSKVDLEKIEEFVTHTMEENNIVGSAVTVFYLKNDSLTKGFGKIDKAGVAVGENTPFNIGSMTKSFTAFAILQLEEAGKMKLDDFVVKHLPEFRTENKNLSDQITIQHLLNHNSGFTTLQGNRMQASDYNERDALNKTVKDYQKVSLQFEPGSHYEYSNANYQILGLLVEQLSKSSYEHYITKNILLPLKMHNASFEATNESAIPHRYIFGMPVKYKNEISRTKVAQGGLYASASDMQKYLKAIISKDSTLVSNLAYQKMFSEDQSGLMKFGFAGWRKRIVEADDTITEVFWHGGQNPGINASMFIVPEINTGISVLTNTYSAFGINSSNPLCYGPVNILLEMAPPVHSSFFGIILIVLWIVPLLLIRSIWKKIRKPGKDKSMKRLIIISLLAFGLCFLLLKLIPNYFGGANFMTVMRFEPEIAFLLLTTSSLLFILVMIDWIKINSKNTAS